MPSRNLSNLLNHDLNQGRSIDLTYGQVDQNIMDTRGADFDPEVLSVYLGYRINAPRLRSTDSLRRLRARIEFATGGATMPRAKIDLLKNTFLSFPASWVRLIIDYERDGEEATGPDITVFSTLGYSAKASSVGSVAPARLTEFTEAVAADAISAPIPIPEYATAYVLQAAAVGGATPSAYAYGVVQRTFSTSAGEVGAISVQFPQSGDTSEAVPLANGAQFLTVQNNAAIPIAFSIIFYLSF